MMTGAAKKVRAGPTNARKKFKESSFSLNQITRLETKNTFLITQV